MIVASNLSYSYSNKIVVRQVSLSTTQGKILGLVGPNGSGKTTLLRMLYGSLKPTNGQLMLNGRPLHNWSTREIARHIAVVVQQIEGETMLTNEEMVALGRIPSRRPFIHKPSRDRHLVNQALERVGALSLAQRSFSSLSGGERQRVLIARALAQEAEILLLDEPTNHLDIRYQHEVLQLVQSLGTTTVVVLHDLNLAAEYCDELIMLNDGKVYAQGTPDEVLTVKNVEKVYRVATQRHPHGKSFSLTFKPLQVNSLQYEEATLA